MSPRRHAERAFSVALLLLPIGVIGNIAYTLLATDRALLASVSSLPRTYLIAALLLTLTPWVTATLRLRLWTGMLSLRIPLRDLLRMALVVDVGSAISPTAVGGEAFKWGLLVKHGVRPGTAASLALLPKIEDAVFFAIALPVAILVTRAWTLPVVDSSVRMLGGNVTSVVAVLALIAIAAWLVNRLVRSGLAGARLQRWLVRTNGRVRRRMRRTLADARDVFGQVLVRGRLRFMAALALTAIHWIARYGVISALALFLGVPFDPVLFWLLQWVVFTIMSFVPTPGAAGGAEIAFTAVYATLLPVGTIGIATAAWRMFTFYVPVALAAALFFLLGRREAATAGAAVEPA